MIKMNKNQIKQLKDFFAVNNSVLQGDNKIFALQSIKFSLFLYVIIVSGISICSLLHIDSFAIQPLNTDGWWKIGTSWLVHENFEHYKNNMIILSQLLLVFLLVEKDKMVFIWLVLISGSFTWLFGGSGYHLGASGLIFALIGYMFLSIFRNIWYLIFIIIMSSQLTYIVFNGLIPHDGISFSAHAGGFLSGLVIAYLKNKNRKTIQFF